MADFTGVIRRAVEGLANNTPEARQKVYDRARQTIQRQLDAMPNSSSSAIFERQLSSVEDAIKEIEAQYAGGAAPDSGAATPPAAAPAAPKPAASAPVTQTPVPEKPAPSASTPPAEPVSKPVEPVVEKKADPKPVEVETKSAEPEAKPADKPAEKPAEKPALAPASAEAKAEPKIEPEPETAAPEDTSSKTNESKTETVAPAESEPKVVVEEPVAPTPVVEEVVAPVEIPTPTPTSAPAANEIDNELAIPAADSKVEAASLVNEKVSEIVNDVTSKIDADKSAKEMPKADSSFLTDENIIDQAVGEIKSSLQGDPDDVNPDFPDHDSAFGFGAEALPEAPEPKRKKSPIVMIIAAALLVLAGSAYGIWRYGAGDFGGGDTQVAEVADTTVEADTSTAPEEPAEEREVVTKVEDTTPTTNDNEPVGESEKFTQRLNADGTEEDPGPSPELINGLPGEEGRSVASQSDGQTTTAPVETAQDDPAPAADGAPAIEKMLFYETSLGLEQQARYEGGVTWTEEIESDGSASRPFIKAQIQVPERNLSIDMSIKLNGDQTLPVSHLVDINFSLPDDFEGGEIDQVTEVKMKNTEEQPGDRLAAISAKIDTTFFVVGLENDDPEVVATNLQLLSRRNWIDIPISYSNGRKALITLEKGASGVAVFDKVLAAWERNPVQ
jgi:hypothetical protein